MSQSPSLQNDICPYFLTYSLGVLLFSWALKMFVCRAERTKGWEKGLSKLCATLQNVLLVFFFLCFWVWCWTGYFYSTGKTSTCGLYVCKRRQWLLQEVGLHFITLMSLLAQQERKLLLDWWLSLWFLWAVLLHMIIILWQYMVSAFCSAFYFILFYSKSGVVRNVCMWMQ